MRTTNKRNKTISTYINVDLPMIGLYVIGQLIAVGKDAVDFLYFLIFGK